MHILRNFKVHELVDERTFKEFGNQALKFFRTDILQGLDELRDLLGKPLIVNDWKDGGPYEWSGLRTIDTYLGARWSPHRLGAAFDIKCKTMGAPYLQDFIRRKKEEGLLRNIRRMEIGTIGWTHIDSLEHPRGVELYEFKP